MRIVKFSELKEHAAMRLSLFGLCMLTIGACVEPFHFSVGAQPTSIVINGAITNLPGPYTVEVYTTQSVDRTRPETMVRSATVTIQEEGGPSEQLVETAPGVYQTASLQGEVGKTYTLSVVTAEGNSYASSAEQMLPVGKFTHMRAEFELKVPVLYDPLISLDQAATVFKNGFRLYIDAEFDPAQEGRAMWAWSGVYQFRTYPEDHFYVIGTKIVVPDPLPCSGYVYVGNGTFIIKGKCTCCYCYHTNHNTTPLISDERIIEQNQIKRQYIGFVPADPWFFSNKYLIIIEQRSVSQKVYDFWKHVKIASELGSDLFQVPPVASVGNVTAENPGAMPVIGIFSAYSLKTDTLILHESKVPYTLPELQHSLTSCINFYRKDNTDVRPPYYPFLRDSL